MGLFAVSGLSDLRIAGFCVDSGCEAGVCSTRLLSEDKVWRRNLFARMSLLLEDSLRKLTPNAVNPGSALVKEFSNLVISVLEEYKKNFRKKSIIP